MFNSCGVDGVHVFNHRFTQAAIHIEPFALIAVAIFNQAYRIQSATGFIRKILKNLTNHD